MDDYMDGKGQFKKGFDPRRQGGKKRVEIARGMSLAEIAQMHTKEALDMLASFVNNTELDGEPRTDGKRFPTSSRVRSAEILLAYGHGRPETILKVQEISRNSQQSLSHLTTERLIQLVDNDELIEDIPQETT